MSYMIIDHRYIMFPMGGGLVRRVSIDPLAVVGEQPDFMGAKPPQPSSGPWMGAVGAAGVKARHRGSKTSLGWPLDGHWMETLGKPILVLSRVYLKKRRWRGRPRVDLCPSGGRWAGCTGLRRRGRCGLRA